MKTEYANWNFYEVGKKYEMKELQQLEHRTQKLREDERIKPLLESTGLRIVYDGLQMQNYIPGLIFEYNQLLNFAKKKEGDK